MVLRKLWGIRDSEGPTGSLTKVNYIGWLTRVNQIPQLAPAGSATAPDDGRVRSRSVDRPLQPTGLANNENVRAPTSPVANPITSCGVEPGLIARPSGSR